MKAKETAPPARAEGSGAALRGSYRHGDLRRALLDAAVALARAGGPGAVVLREATRQAGVAPNAAYRHYANHDELLQAVRGVALSSMARAIEAELARQDKARKAATPAERARASLRSVGTAYVNFALAEPGLFRTAFSVPPQLRGAPAPAKEGESGLDPYQLLGMALDRFVEAGLLPAARRPGAEYLAWSAVHGLAMLVIDGPLQPLSLGQARAVGQRLLDMVEKGLS